MLYSDYNNTASILTPESTGLNGDIYKYESTGTYNMQGGRRSYGRRSYGKRSYSKRSYSRRRTNGRHTNRRRTNGRHNNSRIKPPKSFLSFLDFLR